MLSAAKKAAESLTRPLLWAAQGNAGIISQSRCLNTRTASESLNPERIQWVFLGPPGVGKGTYSTRVAVALGVAHIAAGDLVRGEIKAGSDIGKKMQSIVSKGELLPADMVYQLLEKRIQDGKTHGEKGFVLDGFPRTRQQAEVLTSALDIQLAVNLSLREEVLVQKCMGRRICRKCGKNWNIADIYLKSQKGEPEIIMPPLEPPEDCLHYMEQREDDTEEVIRRRLEVYHKEASPVEDFFRQKGVLMDFEITKGIPETLPNLLSALKPHVGNWELADIHI